MTRIFEAFKKAQATHPPAPLEAARSHPAASHGSAAPALRPSVPAGIVLLPRAATLEGDVLREMTALRVAIEAALPDRTTRLLLFSSSTPGEGATTVAVQFANSLAADPRCRVLVVDAHARRPALARELDRQLQGHRIEAAHAAQGSLSVLPLDREQHASGILSPQALRGLLDSVAGSYDWILLDGPPVLEAPEAPSLGAVTDGVVLVVRAGRTKRPVLARSVDLLRQAGARVIGTVLNRRRHEIPGFIYRRI